MTRHIDKTNCCWSCYWAEDVVTGFSRVPCIVACKCKESDHYGHILNEDHPACEKYKRAG